MSAPDAVRRLVENFDRHRDAYKSGNYNETQVRVDYIDPMFVALGWDVHNTQGHAEAYRDVLHEFSLKVGVSTKAPDYCFRIGQSSKFFVEAKQPSVSLKDAPEPAFQLRRYAWSAKLPLSILTDFEEFAVYDCRVRPVKTDKSSTARIEYIRFEDYETKWDEIASVFSKTAILQGSFDKYVESKKKKRGTAEVDEAFLSEIEHWRELLAKNINLRNRDRGLAPRELNEAVQKTIDRIIFLRICEDRGIEPYLQLQALTSGDRTYDRLKVLFHRADERYNSGLFHFRHEKERGSPDGWTLDLEIDDKPLKEILKKLYYPDSPYEFSVLPADILGQVYEQFLGKVITPKGLSVSIEDKPEVKKAGGVYYTPTYIVQYIVEHTVGKLLEGKTPDEVMGKGRAKDAHPLRVLDPACGSGSFLIGAYQQLLDWYLSEYTKEPEKHLKAKAPRICESGREGRAPARPASYRLTTSERKRILIDHIYGVDIDPQAVEVTKLSLLLKVLEGETAVSIQSQLDLFHHRALPDLDNNIKCGNSLIGPDFYDDPENAVLPEGDRRKINAFDWKAEFKDVFSGGNPGFDAVIGNPPYIRIQALREWNPEEASFYEKRYQSASEGSFDIYLLFIERGIWLLSRTGRIGLICPSKFFSNDYGRPLRSLISNRHLLEHIVDFGHHQVFKAATTYTCLLFLANVPIENFEIVHASPDQVRLQLGGERSGVRAGELNDSPWIFLRSTDAELFRRLNSEGIPLGNLLDNMARGISTGNDDVFVLDSDSRMAKDLKEEKGILIQPVFAADFGRYAFQPQSRFLLIFPYKIGAGTSELMSEAEIRDLYPRTYSYLAKYRNELEKRKGKVTWYGFSAPRNLHVHVSADIYVPLLANRGSSTLAPDNQRNFCLMAGAGFSLNLKKHPALDRRLVLALLNSNVAHWCLSKISTKFRGGWVTCTKQFFARLPLPAAITSGDVERQDRCIVEVDRMVRAVKQLADAKTQHDRSLTEREIERTDREIDRLVYELYGLTEAEIKIVEEATK